MKPTRSGTKWVHVSCALWIPEVGAPSVVPVVSVLVIRFWPFPYLSSLWSVLWWGLGHYPAVSRASFYYVYLWSCPQAAMHGPELGRVLVYLLLGPVGVGGWHWLTLLGSDHR